MTVALDLAEPAAITGGPVRCEALKADGSGPCARILEDAESRRLKMGPCCRDRIYGTGPQAAGRRFPAGPDQATLPLELPTQRLLPALMDPGAWPCRVTAGVVACGVPGCTAVLAEGVWTPADLTVAAAAHAPSCHGTDPQPALKVE